VNYIQSKKCLRHNFIICDKCFVYTELFAKQQVSVQVYWQVGDEVQFVCDIYKLILFFITDNFLVLKNYVIFVSDLVTIFS